jgi:hypothetical protein
VSLCANQHKARALGEVPSPHVLHRSAVRAAVLLGFAGAGAAAQASSPAISF